MENRSNRRGFSLVEMMASVGIVMVISASVLYVMTTYQKSYRLAQVTEDMRSTVRAAVALMSQEIGQAGLLTSPALRTLTAPVTVKGAQNVAISSTSNLFAGQKLAIDVGTSREVVTLTAIVDPHTIAANFTTTHLSAALVDGSGVFATGILTTDPGSRLQFYGDMNGDGHIYFVEYACDIDAAVLTRSVTDIEGVVDKSPAAIMAGHIVVNPDGSPCFQPVTATIGGKTYVTSVGITVSIQSASPDPFTGKYVTMSKSMLNLSPRNVLAALDLLSQSPVPERVQPKPPNVPLS